MQTKWMLTAFAAALACGAAAGQEAASLRLAESAAEAAPDPGAALREIAWDARAAEHLFNRAGFGARPAEIERAVAIGLDATVEELLAGSGFEADPFAYEPTPRPSRREAAAMGEEERRAARARYRREDREALARYAGWWIERMIESQHPLRERMALFWHGHFTSSYREVRSAEAMIRQNALLREHALGSFAELVRGIVRDPAMLAYLDGDKNRKGKPNENLARELMELFTLGEGSYTEDDVLEAARALTGWRVARGSAARFDRRQHDRGRKSVLGVTGRLGADGLVDVLLAQPACPRWIAARVIVYFEGRRPSEERLERYAGILREGGYEMAPFLRALFRDPEFYSGEVVGARIAGPVDYLAGTCRRLGARPRGELVWLAAGQLGQRLFDPPSVKGWDGGMAWITTASLLGRGNVAGMLLGVVRPEDLFAPETLEAEEGMEPSMAEGERAPTSAARARGRGLAPLGWRLRARPSLEASLRSRCAQLGARSDEQIVGALCSELLAVEASAGSRAALLGFLAAERAGLRVAEGELLREGRRAERLLRRLAHLILSLPEAQLT